MKRAASAWVAVFITYAVVCLPGTAQELKPYPGSQFDEKASRQASQAVPGKQSQVYTTPDTFDSVYAFYKRRYKEYTMPMPPPALPSGKKLQWAFFILDEGRKLADSKYWVKIQRPYVGTISEDPNADFQDIHDITAIQTVRQK